MKLIMQALEPFKYKWDKKISMDNISLQIIYYKKRLHYSKVLYKHLDFIHIFLISISN